MDVDEDFDNDNGAGEMQGGAMITALAWVKKGYAKALIEIHDPN